MSNPGRTPTTSSDPRSDPIELPSGKVAPVPVATGYRVALVAVAVAMVLLPLVYLAIVAGAAWGGYAYLRHAWPASSAIGSWAWSPGRPTPRG